VRTEIEVGLSAGRARRIRRVARFLKDLVLGTEASARKAVGYYCALLGFGRDRRWMNVDDVTQSTTDDFGVRTVMSPGVCKLVVSGHSYASDA